MLKLTHFSPMFHFYTPWKRQKTFGFVTSNGTYCAKMGWLQHKNNFPISFSTKKFWKVTPVSLRKNYNDIFWSFNTLNWIFYLPQSECMSHYSAWCNFFFCYKPHLYFKNSPYRSSHPEVFCRKGVLRCFPVNFAKFLRTPLFIEHLWWLLSSLT